VVTIYLRHPSYHQLITRANAEAKSICHFCMSQPNAVKRSHPSAALPRFCSLLLISKPPKDLGEVKPARHG
jgi:hypothetical protein